MKTKLKYIAYSSASNLKQENLDEQGGYKVFGASGYVGQSKSFGTNKPYIGIIKDGAGVGRSSVYEPYTSILGTMAYIFPNKNININWLNYVLISLNLEESIDKTTIPHIYFSDYGNRTLEYFDFDVQSRISEFLNQKCIEIEYLITDIKKEIEILTQYKKAIITETVTKGLNKDIKLKNSGIEWAKQIPEHWEVSRIANVYKLRIQKVSDREFEPLSVTMKGIFPQWDNVAKSDAHDDRKLVRKGDFAINSRSDRRGSCGISDRDGSVSLINLVLQPLTNMNPNYYNWLFHTESFADEFYKWGHGIVNDLWTTNWQDMKRILIPQPPIQEQREIAEYLDKKCKEIDSILEDKNKQLETLESYKKSIIYEYVTGKKEVK